VISILEDRYGRGWVAWSCDPEDVDVRFNGGDPEHYDLYRAKLSYPVGWGFTPDAARDALLRERKRYEGFTDFGGYTTCLADQERAGWEQREKGCEP
jgi:hypothetical protein